MRSMLFARAMFHSSSKPRNVGNGKVFVCISDMYIKNINVGV